MKVYEHLAEASKAESATTHIFGMMGVTGWSPLKVDTTPNTGGH